MRQFRQLRDGHWLAILAAVMGLTCTGELDRFLAEDRPLSLQARVDMASPPQLDTGSQVFTFSVTLRIDRAGHYNIVHGSSCDGGKPPAGIPHTGTIGPNEDKNVAVSIQLNDIEEFGKYVVLCASDSGNYQKASQTIALQPMLDYLAQLNEATGQGLPLNSTIAEEFAIFQNDWTMGVSNRGQPSTVQNGVFRPLQFAAFIDPNDSYRIKFFVADYGNNRVIVFHRQPQPWGDTAAVVIGQPDFFSGDTNAGGVVNAAGLNYPTSVAVSAQGRLFISDSGNNRILIFKSIPKANGQPADFAIGQPDLSSDTANNSLLAGSQKLSWPTGISIYHARLFVADSANNRVLVFNTVPTGMAPHADFPIGQPDFDTTSPGTDYLSNFSYLKFPCFVAFDDNRLYLSDHNNHRVLVFNSIPTAPNAKPSLVIGQPDSAAAAANCGSAFITRHCLNFPSGIFVRAEKLAVADYANHRVLIFALPIAFSYPAATHVLGQPNFSSATPSTSQTGLYHPAAVFLDKSHIWISDSDNNRLVVWQLP